MQGNWSTRNRTIRNLSLQGAGEQENRGTRNKEQATREKRKRNRTTSFNITGEQGTRNKEQENKITGVK